MQARVSRFYVSMLWGFFNVLMLIVWLMVLLVIMLRLAMICWLASEKSHFWPFGSNECIILSSVQYWNCCVVEWCRVYPSTVYPTDLHKIAQNVLVQTFARVCHKQATFTNTWSYTMLLILHNATNQWLTRHLTMPMYVHSGPLVEERARYPSYYLDTNGLIMLNQGRELS